MTSRENTGVSMPTMVPRPRDTDRLFGDHGETEGDQQAQDRIGGVETAQDVPFNRMPSNRDAIATTPRPGRSRVFGDLTDA